MITIIYYTYDALTKQLSPAKRVIDNPDGSRTANPTAEQCAAIGAHPRADDPAPTPPEGKVAIPDGYELRDNAWHRAWRYEDAPPPPPKVYSTSDLIYALMTRGVYDQCREWIAEQGLLDLVLATKEFTSDLENFETIKTGLQQLLGYTDEQVAEVLAEAEVG